MMHPFIARSRRGFLIGGSAVAASAVLSACATPPPRDQAQLPPEVQPVEPVLEDYATMYGPVFDNGFEVPAVPFEKIDPQFLRQMVNDPTGSPPGTIVVDTSSHFLYFVSPGGRAIRYGVGLGRAGFEWAGNGTIKSKQVWPRWFPPEEMIARQPELEKYRARQIPGTNEWEGGMPGGLDNPLGARALYIFRGEEDTLYRVHGSPEWASIGKSVSSGCVRLINQDAIDLYNRAPEQSPIVVMGGAAPMSGPMDQGIPIDSGVPVGSVLLGRL